MTWAKWDKCQTRSLLVKERIANIVSGYPIQKHEYGLTSPFQVCTLCCVHLFCNFMLKTKPCWLFCISPLFAFLIFPSDFHVSGSQNLCSVRTPRALLRSTHHYGGRHSRELTQRIPWGRMVEQVASQAPCRPSKKSQQISLFTEFCQMKSEMWKSLLGACQIRSSDWLLKVTHFQVPIVQPCHVCHGRGVTGLEWFCWSEPFRQEDIHTWISKSFRLTCFFNIYIYI